LFSVQLADLLEVNTNTWSKFSYKIPSESSSHKAMATSPPVQATRKQLALTSEVLPFANATAILDIAAGPGTVFNELFTSTLALSPSATLLAQDVSPFMIEQIKVRQSSSPEWARVHTDVSDATNLSAVASDSKSHVVSSMGIFLIPDSASALSEAYRVLAPGGVFSMSSVARGSWISETLSLLTDIYPDRVVPLPAETWRRADLFQAELERAGFEDVHVSEAELYMSFDDHAGIVETLWNMLPFMPSLTKGLTEKQVKEAKEMMVANIKKKFPEVPGKLPGLSLIGVGRK